MKTVKRKKAVCLQRSTSIMIALLLVLGTVMSGGTICVTNARAETSGINVESVYPADGGQDVETDTEISVTFDREICEGTNFEGIAIKDEEDNEVTGISGTITGNMLAIGHDALEYDTIYSVSVPAYSVTDAVYNSVYNNEREIVWNFKTIPQVLRMAGDGLTLVKWDFENNSATASDGIYENLGQELYVGEYETVQHSIEEDKASVGTNSTSSNPENKAARSKGWVSTKNPQTIYWGIQFTTLGYENLSLSSDQYSQIKSSYEGPRDFSLEYSLDKATWVGIAEITVGTDYTTTKVDLPEELENRETVYIRWYNTSDISINGGTTHQICNNYIDNIIVTGQQMIEQPLSVLEFTPGEYPPVLCDTDAEISVTFNKPIQASDNIDEISIKRNSNVQGISSFISGSRLIIRHPVLDNDGYYTVTVPAGSVADESGTPYDNDITWLIRTNNNDTEPPVITSKSPDDNADCYKHDEDVTVTYNETVQEGENFNSISIKDNLDNTVSSVAASVSGKILSVSHDDFEIGSSYTVSIPAGAVKDTADNATETFVAWSFTVKEQTKETYNCYFGQIHSHTNLSDGSGTPNEAYTWARDQGQADFFAITDHSNSFDNEYGSENISDWNDSGSSEWKQLNSAADSFNVDGQFVAIAGYEMTWSDGTGHMNTYNTPWFMSRDNGIDLKGYYDKIKQWPQSINQFNHPGTTFGYFEEFGNYSAEVDNVIQLIEVGNGDGKVGGSGYYPSYEYYTMALDKGWHLAPTNNQDNHNKKWITANDARMVILASELTREAIFDSIRNYRVYSTEDKNLEISYYVNDKIMGSSIGDADTLDFSISVNDPDSSDSIDSISIISDGGAVAASKDFDSADAEWNFELSNNYAYYYVKVVEEDGDIAVTAPVWSDSLVPVGFSCVKASQNPTTPGTEIELEAVVYNNSSEEIQDINVEFYAEDNKIGESSISTVPKGDTGSAVIRWMPQTTGNFDITARASISAEGTTKEVVASTLVKVLDSSDIKYVVIDGGHYNAYVTGNYSGSYSELKELLDNNNYITSINMDELTADDLTGADVIILSDPGSKDDNYTSKSYYTEAELMVISNFVNGGGAVIVTSLSDYGEAYYGINGQYQSAVQNNKILEAVGSNMRFNDDELYDTSNNVEGTAYKLQFNDYISPDLYGLVTDDITGQSLRVYSSSSVILKDGGSDEAIDWIVNLHPTTVSYDSDGSNDSANPSSGEFYVIGAEALDNGGKVAAAGATIFSDFEFADSLDEDLSNKEIILNILDWMTEEAAPEKISISQARIDADSNGIPDLLGEKVTIEGVVTAESTAYTEEYGRNNAFFDVLYIQDETGGMTIFNVSNSKVPIGAAVRITGEIDQYNGDTEVQVDKENRDVSILDTDPAYIKPKVLSTGNSMKEQNEGWLIQVRGTVARMDGSSLYIDDGTGEARVFVDGYIGDGTGNNAMLGAWSSDIKAGDEVIAIGLASEDTAGHRIRVRNTAEIGESITKPAPALTPDTTYNLVGMPIDVIFMDNGDWRVSVNDIKIDGNSIESSKYTINSGELSFVKDVFTEEKDYIITVAAQNFEDTTVKQTILVSGQSLTPPVLKADTSNNTPGSRIDIEFTDNETWRNAITEITVDGTVLTSSQYSISSGIIAINGGIMTSEKTYVIAVKAEGFTDAVVYQGIAGSPKAVIDGGHSNAYVSGDYSNKGTGMKKVLEENGFEYSVNNDTLTESDLDGVKLLILTDPGKSSSLTEGELDAIDDFVQSGGTLILTSRADYNDASGDYQNSVQGNRVLEAIGSNMRFNDDELLEGSDYTIYFNNYEIPDGSSSSKFELVDNSMASQQFRIYSGASVYLKNGGIDENIDWIVKLNSSTSHTDADGKGDWVDLDDSVLHILGAEILGGGGKVVAAGATFFSDYEIVDTSYSNKGILDNICQWSLEGGLITPPVLVPDSTENYIGINIEITFEDDELWRNGITEVEAGDTVLGSSQYTVESGKIIINGSVFENPGDYTITVIADGYENSTVIQNIKLDPGVIYGKYLIKPEVCQECEIGTSEDGISKMTVKSGVTGFKYFTVAVDVVEEHQGEEVLVYTHIRNNIQIGLNAVRVDFDTASLAAKGGFNVQPGDIIRVYMVDDLTNDEDFTSTILQ